LFGFNSRGSITPCILKTRIWSFTLTRAGTVVQDLIPAKSGNKYDGQAAPGNCMYDLVTKTFFTNAGTGTFNYVEE
jgi:hypothetical protein